ncbi:MAG: hypothetical protein MUP09_02130 [Thiovulaceae bacterium]|nr:hypothetical protein [Sulfurimonadaceae bacterium]
MKKLLLALFMSISLFAQNPISFAALGDVIYNDLPKFEQVGNLAVMRDSKPLIDDYIQEAGVSREMGLAVDKNDKSSDPKAYLKALRILSTKHDTIVLNAGKRFEEAMQDEDSETVIKMITIGIVNPQDYKSKLIRYYEDHGEDENLSVIEPFYKKHLLALTREQNVSKRGDTEAVNNVELIKHMRASEKASHDASVRSVDDTEAVNNEELIKRMRATERARHDALVRSVNEESRREKQKVLDEQKKALGIE